MKWEDEVTTTNVDFVKPYRGRSIKFKNGSKLYQLLNISLQTFGNSSNSNSFFYFKRSGTLKYDFASKTVTFTLFHDNTREE